MSNDLLIGFLYGMQFTLLIKIMYCLREIKLIDSAEIHSLLKDVSINHISKEILKQFLLMFILSIAVFWIQ